MVERFWSKVDKNGPIPAHIPELSNCWQWTAGTFKYGYGRFWTGEKGVSAHRAAWVLENGDIPDGLCVLHKCDNPPCVRVAHLFLGTRLDNNRDRDAKNRTARFIVENRQKVQCPKGHPLDYYYGKHRSCKECRHNAVRRWRLRDRSLD